MGKGSARRPGEGYEANFGGIFGKADKLEPTWDDRRKELEAAVIDAALELARFTGTAGFTVPLPDSDMCVTLGAKREYDRRRFERED